MNNIELIAEIGWNHMGNMRLAKKMIVAAKKSGATYCKFQTWSVDNLTEGAWDSDGRRKIYEKAQLTLDKHKYLIKECKKNKIKFLTSVFNLNDIKNLKKLNLKEIKIPSHEIHNLELIKSCIKNFKRVFISTGASKWSEIKKIKKIIKNKKNICLMHCVSSYPCLPENINLPRLKSLSKLSTFLGYSGHMGGINDAIASICFGATVIEKHFTINKKLPGRDNKNAILPEDMKALAEFANNYKNMSINRGLDLQKCEMDIFKNYRGRWSK